MVTTYYKCYMGYLWFNVFVIVKRRHVLNEIGRCDVIYILLNMLIYMYNIPIHMYKC